MKKLGFIIGFSTLFAFGLSAQTLARSKPQTAPKASAQSVDNSRGGTSTNSVATTAPSAKKQTSKKKSKFPIASTATPAPARVKNTQTIPAASHR